MTRIHAFVIALAVAFAVVAGAFAAFRTTQLGTTATARVSPVVLAAQTRQLDDSSSKLHRALRTHPPSLRRVPKLKKPKLPTGTPPAVVHVVHVTAPATPTTATTPAAPPPVRTTPAQATRVATTRSTSTRTTTTPATTHRTHERETGQHDPGSNDSREHTTTSTTTTTTTTTTTPDD